MTPRQTADDFFNRVMAASENGDTLSARQFLPMALQAYEAARPLDMDGLFHVALLQRTGDMFEASLATALEMLEREPNHIMGLEVAAQATSALGREDEAAGFFQKILDNHDAEIGRPLPEYQSHSNYFAVARNAALDFLVGR
jgi:tetratricopeptide (TPR) repeat protein